MKILLKTFYLYEVQIAQTKLESRGIPSYIRNEFVNHVAVMPVAENYMLMVNEADFESAAEILREVNDEREEEESD
ncbi:DUF2007 domain-containing protein [Chryseobacterium sp. MFBS3-17]|uniref:putative signal transducing protein n=1 Tax=Chryseobacterium sp. MFBS3-17 TaxID=2886689 RepID=UPI001D0DFEB2|nr:DUF2007 domain-containing protein [Chryseobacterium sp. MFBS3-17]MCC2589801.1 DUF2007 domain-containing protein [Chryseobacterium sp. MFBS3-17]